MEQLSDKEDFYWSNIASILKEVKETESIGKIPKKYICNPSILRFTKRIIRQ